MVSRLLFVKPCLSPLGKEKTPKPKHVRLYALFPGASERPRGRKGITSKPARPLCDLVHYRFENRLLRHAEALGNLKRMITALDRV